jgi:surface polysaccharide O-acyltransferase-like enzyme
MQKTLNRMVAIDLLKTLAIFGVVFIHSNNENVITEYISEMFRFAVPVFVVFFTFFLEKSLSNVTSKQEYFSILTKKFYMLFVPYIFFTIVYFFILNDVSKIQPRDLITGYWSGMGWSGQYFFIVLFQLIIFFPLIQKLSNIKTKWIFFLFILNLLFYILMAYALWQIPIISNISDRLFIYWIPYAILGILLYRNINYFKQFANAYVVILSLMLIPLEFIVLDYYKFIHSPYVLPTVLIASVLISIYFIVHNNLIASYMSEQVKNLSVYISKRTLGIFVLNPYFIFLLKPYITLENS